VIARPALSAVACALALAGCGATHAPAPTPTADVPAPSASTAVPPSAPASAPPLAEPPPDAGAPFACKLPAPKLSDDPCRTDADCGPSEPCHAPACVAKAKAHPRGPDTVCTEMLACDTADANRCGCYEGRCALIP
jgi:hypothetical protein